AAPTRSRYCRRPYRFATAYALHHSGDLSLVRMVPGTRPRSRALPAQRPLSRARVWRQTNSSRACGRELIGFASTKTLKRLSYCQIVGRRSPQKLARLDPPLKFRGCDRSASRASGHFLKFVGHWLLVSRLAPSLTREAEQTPGCDSLGEVARDWRGKEIHVSPEAPFPVQQYSLNPHAPKRFWPDSGQVEAGREALP